MKIRLAILEKDETYLNRLVSVFNSKYSEELEVYSYTEAAAALAGLAEKKIKVLLAFAGAAVNPAELPEDCGFAWLVESTGIDRLEGRKAVCKFQRAEQLYKQVVAIFSEQIPDISGSKPSSGGVRVLAFTSPVGGAGASTAAAGCAVALAQSGKRVLFLSQSLWGSSDRFFACDGQFTFSDVVFAMKSSHGNRGMKLQSLLKQDDCGVFFYADAHLVLDQMELTPDDWDELLREIGALGCFDAVVLDTPFPGNAKEFARLAQNSAVVLVAEDTPHGYRTIERAAQTMAILEEQGTAQFSERLWMLLNHSCGSTPPEGLRLLGSFPTYQRVEPAQMARQFALSGCYRVLL